MIFLNTKVINIHIINKEENPILGFSPLLFITPERAKYYITDYLTAILATCLAPSAKRASIT